MAKMFLKQISLGLLGGKKKKKDKKKDVPITTPPPSLFSPPQRDTGEPLAEKTVLGGF